MTMFLGTLVVAVLVGLGAGDSVPQPFKQSEAALVNATKLLLENLISMEGHIPLLNDPRRHYAEIVHVVNFISLKQTVYPYYPYKEVYYKYLNDSAGEGISKPQKVISEIQYLLDEVHDATRQLTQIINGCNLTDFHCNALIHDIVTNDRDSFGVPVLIFLAAARTATEFNKLSEKFEEVSKDLNASHYVCTSPDDLRVLVAELAYLYQILNDLPHEHDD